MTETMVYAWACDSSAIMVSELMIGFELNVRSSSDDAYEEAVASSYAASAIASQPGRATLGAWRRGRLLSQVNSQVVTCHLAGCTLQPSSHAATQHS